MDSRCLRSLSFSHLLLDSTSVQYRRANQVIQICTCHQLSFEFVGPSHKKYYAHVSNSTPTAFLFFPLPSPRELEQLIDRLPDDHRTAEQQIHDIAAAQRQSHQVGEEVAGVAGEVRRQLDVLEGLHAGLVDELLPKQSWIAEDPARIAASVARQQQGGVSGEEGAPQDPEGGEDAMT